MHNDSAIKIPTPEEFLAKYNNAPYSIGLLTGAAIMIKRGYKELLQDIEKDKKYEVLYEGLSDPNVINELKQNQVFNGWTNDRINAEIKLIKKITQPGEARRLLWAIRQFERKYIIPGLPKKDAINFILDLKYDDIMRATQNQSTAGEAS